MVSALHRRLKRIEDRRNPPKRLPNVIERYRDEDEATAIARFCKLHGIFELPPSFPVLWLPVWRTMDEFRTYAKKQQTELLAMARTVKTSGNA